MIRNLSQFKKQVVVGSKIIIVENAIKSEHDNQKREVVKTQGNAINTIKENGQTSWVYFQKARNMRFNNDDTVDFLVGEEMNDEWLVDELSEVGKDYWLKIKVL